jgi:hypothetical protein
MNEDQIPATQIKAKQHIRDTFDHARGRRKEVLNAKDNEDTPQGPLQDLAADRGRETPNAVRDHALGRENGYEERREDETFQAHRTPKTATHIEGKTNIRIEMGNGAKVKNVEKRRNVKRKSERKRSVSPPVSVCQESIETPPHRKNGLLELCPTGESTALFQKLSSCALPSMVLYAHVTIPQYLHKEPRILHMASRGTKSESRNNFEGTTKERVFSVC